MEHIEIGFPLEVFLIQFTDHFHEPRNDAKANPKRFTLPL